MATKPSRLEPSELGTREYWDNLYTTELANHVHDPSNIGTVWFDDSDAEAKVIEFLDDFFTTESSSTPSSSVSFLDLGTGNGSLLFGLRDAGWAGRMLGVDYSRQSVEFARRVARSRLTGNSASDGEEEQENQDQDPGPVTTAAAEVEFLEHDILRTPSSALLTGAQARGWDVVLDKGTFDAVSLSSETDAATGHRVGGSYRARVLPLVRADGGLFLVTSCNWTEDELRAWFVGSAAEEEGGQDDDDETRGWKFQEVGKVNYPSFSFGGVKGQTISTLCFKKIKNDRS
ncbi:putative S-adenosylmethionine-dependent methyltransferase of the seven beta-strand family [Hypoxylon sp. FL1284]|nr:putative S-adenosylmethionine-dependent methyltransferase of the seven beta-strand family [Hypoxylon sp. FL1284]